MADAAAAIAARRRKTTIKETELTLEADTYVYELPDDAVQVVSVVLAGDEVSGREILPEFPRESFGLRGQSRLPTGQSISQSVDLILRQNRRTRDREVRWRLESGSLVLDFNPTDGRKLRVVYRAEDRSVEAIPERHWQAIANYCRFQALGVSIERAIQTGDFTGDSLLRQNISALREARHDLESQWNHHLATISPEVD